MFFRSYISPVFLEMTRMAVLAFSAAFFTVDSSGLKEVFASYFLASSS